MNLDKILLSMEIRGNFNENEYKKNEEDDEGKTEESS